MLPSHISRRLSTAPPHPAELDELIGKLRTQLNSLQAQAARQRAALHKREASYRDFLSVLHDVMHTAARQPDRLVALVQQLAATNAARFGAAAAAATSAPAGSGAPGSPTAAAGKGPAGGVAAAAGAAGSAVAGGVAGATGGATVGGAAVGGGAGGIVVLPGEDDRVSAADVAIIAESERQCEHLSAMVAKVRRAAAEEGAAHKRASTQLVTDNMQLIGQIKELRAQVAALKLAQKCWNVDRPRAVAALTQAKLGHLVASFTAAGGVGPASRLGSATGPGPRSRGATAAGGYPRSDALSPSAPGSPSTRAYGGASGTTGGGAFGADEGEAGMRAVGGSLAGHVVTMPSVGGGDSGVLAGESSYLSGAGAAGGAGGFSIRSASRQGTAGGGVAGGSHIPPLGSGGGAGGAVAATGLPGTGRPLSGRAYLPPTGRSRVGGGTSRGDGAEGAEDTQPLVAVGRRADSRTGAAAAAAAGDGGAGLEGGPAASSSSRPGSAKHASLAEAAHGGVAGGGSVGLYTGVSVHSGLLGQGSLLSSGSSLHGFPQGAGGSAMSPHAVGLMGSGSVAGDAAAPRSSHASRVGGAEGSAGDVSGPVTMRVPSRQQLASQGQGVAAGHLDMAAVPGREAGGEGGGSAQARAQSPAAVGGWRPASSGSHASALPSARLGGGFASSARGTSAGRRPPSASGAGQLQPGAAAVEAALGAVQGLSADVPHSASSRRGATPSQ
jgi:hypothetical protein